MYKEIKENLDYLLKKKTLDRSDISYIGLMLNQIEYNELVYIADKNRDINLYKVLYLLFDVRLDNRDELLFDPSIRLNKEDTLFMLQFINIDRNESSIYLPKYIKMKIILFFGKGLIDFKSYFYNSIKSIADRHIDIRDNLYKKVSNENIYRSLLTNFLFSKFSHEYTELHPYILSAIDQYIDIKNIRITVILEHSMKDMYISLHNNLIIPYIESLENKEEYQEFINSYNSTLVDTYL